MPATDGPPRKDRSAAWERVTRGHYRPVDSPDPWSHELLAWQESLPPEGCFTHLTGALIRGWAMPPTGAAPVFGWIPEHEVRPRRPGLRISRATGSTAWELRQELRVATAPWILLAAARDLALLDLVVLVDAALRSGDCTISELRLAAALRRRGAPALRTAMRYADQRAESAWESMLRMLHHLCGVPVEPQFPVEGFRADLRIVGTRRLVEYDGEVHRSADRHARDLTRERILQRLGWQRFGYTSQVLLHQGSSVLRDADDALGRRHESGRIRPWHRALNESLFTAAGRQRVAARWAKRQRPASRDELVS